MASIDVFLYSAWFAPETVHGHRLEFVMHDKAKANGYDDVGDYYYADLLWDMLTKEFSCDDKVGPDEMEVYGHYSFKISAPTVESLQGALFRCNKVTEKWINKYRINHVPKERP